MTLRSILQKRHYCMLICLELTNDIIIRVHGEKWGSWWHLMPPGWAKSMSNGHCHSHNIITSGRWLWKGPASPFRDGSSCLISYRSGFLRMPTQGFFLFFVFLKFLPCSGLYLRPAFALMFYLWFASILGFSTLHSPSTSP